MKLYITTIMLTLLILLTGCLEEFEDGYQVGDVLRTAVSLEQDIITYCDEVENDISRQLALEAIHKRVGEIPADGICNLIEED